ncbi:MAG: hypothetical protein HC840_00860 [Leptolyngbyaceae cyanobacterium RM2_2_4]|nr:hypothetical protein [Leptolyngbyaceae cyanobacterium RM2_2_4]
MAGTKLDSRQSVNRSALGMIGSAANEAVSLILSKIDAELAKLFEDRNILLSGGGTLTNTSGTSLAFTSNLILSINSNIAGAAPYTVSIGSSPWSFSADGRMAYVTITSRSAGTFTLTTDASSLPTVTSANQEVFLIAKRVGTTIFFRNGFAVASGRAVTLSTADVYGSVGTTANSLVRTSGTDGKTIQAGTNITIDNSSNMGGVGSLAIGTAATATSVKLQVDATDSGFLPPRMTTTQRDAIATPATGLLIYNTTASALEYYSGTAWLKVSDIYGSLGGTDNVLVRSDGTGGKTIQGTTITIDDSMNVGNVGSMAIGAAATATSVKLQVDSTDSGFLPPRMTQAQRDAIATPATGLVVYNTTNNSVDFYNGTTWLNVSQLKDSSYELSNVTIAPSVGSNALTVALKTKANANPSASDPVLVGFRDSTATSGLYLLRSITSSLSLTVSSGSTLGHASNYSAYIYVYLVDTGSGVVLGVSSKLHDEGTLQSTVAEGGSGAADLSGAIYTAAAQSNKAIRLVARLKSVQTTAGIWAAVPTEASVREFEKERYFDPSNLVINGGFDFWQRNTSFAITTTYAYTADRWKAALSSGTGYTVSQSVRTNVTTMQSLTSLRYQRDNGSSSTANAQIQTVFESRDSLKWRGLPLTISFSILKGTGWTPTAIDARIYSGTGTDQSDGPNFTGSTIVGSTSIAAGSISSTDFTRFSFTTSVLPSNINQIALFFVVAGVGTAGTNDWYEITDVQMNIGTIAIPWRPYGQTNQIELAACQRYFEKSYNLTTNPGTVTGVGNEAIVQVISGGPRSVKTAFKVSKRTTPTVTSYSPTTGTSGQLRNVTDTADQAAGFTDIGESGFTNATNAGVGKEMRWQWTASAEL